MCCVSRNPHLALARIRVVGEKSEEGPNEGPLGSPAAHVYCDTALLEGSDDAQVGQPPCSTAPEREPNGAAAELRHRSSQGM